MHNKPHKENAPGPFYVCDGCCTACDVPFAEAPGMFAYDSANHCYVKRQPETHDELNKMLRAVHGAELECIRYRGNDTDVRRRLAESGLSHLSDIPISGIKPVSRNHVTFDVIDPLDESLSPKQVGDLFQKHVRSFGNQYLTYRFTRLVDSPTRASFSYSWFEDIFHPVEFFFIDLPECRWLVVSDVTFALYDWLIAENRFCNVRWYTEMQWNGSKEWQETPW